MSNRVFAAYGVGLNRAEMAKHCPTAKLIGTMELKNFRLAFRGSNANALATIENAKGGSVPALLWEITQQDEAALDRLICSPELYRKEALKVRWNGTTVEAFSYTLLGDKPLNRPSAFYYSTLLEGYKAAGFDTEILKWRYRARALTSRSFKAGQRNVGQRHRDWAAYESDGAVAPRTPKNQTKPDTEAQASLLFYARRMEAAVIRKLKRYAPTPFKAKDSIYDKLAADNAVAFIECLSHTKGTWAGKPFILIDWQEQIIRDVFGTLKPSGYRQFNTAYIEIPKKNGKSELAAAVALLLTCGDNEERAEVYGCAADRQQASIVFEVAKDMVTMCPALSKRVKILASQKRLVYRPTGSYYQVLSADVANKHGFNTHGVIFDELHTQPNRRLFDVMTKGSGDARMQPLYFLITTAGDNTNSICWEVHSKAKDILDGRKTDPTFYPVIYGTEENDSWTDPKVWKKANPSLGLRSG